MAENVGIYTDDSSMILKINQYSGYRELTCAQILEAIKNTDSYNANAIGFVAVPINQEGYEVQPINYTAGDLLSIWNCFPDWTLAGGDTNYIYWNVSNPTTVNVRSRQYYRAVFSNNKWSFSGYRDAYFGNHTYDNITYYGKGSNSTSLSYSHAVLYISNLSAFTEIYFNGNPLVTYNWQSVPSISGKNGILSLAQIKEEYINDGESVSGVSADHFTNLSTENRVDVLIDDALPAPEIGGTTVTVKYTIPSLSTGSYEYCKLVAKKNSMPEGPEDGDKIINIDPSLTSIVVRGLDGLRKYYFVIFIEDDQGNTASSEPKSCETGEHGNWIICSINDGEDSLSTDVKPLIAVEDGVTFPRDDLYWPEFDSNPYCRSAFYYADGYVGIRFVLLFDKKPTFAKTGTYFNSANPVLDTNTRLWKYRFEESSWPGRHNKVESELDAQFDTFADFRTYVLTPKE